MLGCEVAGVDPVRITTMTMMMPDEIDEINTPARPAPVSTQSTASVLESNHSGSLRLSIAFGMSL